MQLKVLEAYNRLVEQTVRNSKKKRKTKKNVTHYTNLRGLRVLGSLCVMLDNLYLKKDKKINIGCL